MTSTVPASTPFPVPSFNGSDNDASFDQFLDFLRTLISQYLSDNAPRIPSSNREVWVTIIGGLTDHMLATFPMPDIVSWSAMREKVTLVDTTLEVLRRVFERVEGIYLDTTDMVKKIFSRLLNLCIVLNSWEDTGTQMDEAFVEPKLLRERTLQTLLTLLRGLGGSQLTGLKVAEPCWKTLRQILTECLEVCEELMSNSMNLVLPVTFTLFASPRISDIKQEDLFGANPSINPFDITIASSSQLSMMLNTLVQILAHVAVPTLLCQWFIADILRKAVTIMRTVLDYALSPLCSVSLASRARIASDIMDCAMLLQSLNGFATVVSYIPCFLLHYRLHQGPKDAWDAFDQKFSKHLQDIPLKAIPKSNILELMKVLCSETWEQSGTTLRGLGYELLRRVFRELDVKSADSLLDELRLLKDLPQYQAIFELALSARGQPLTTTNNGLDLNVIIQRLLGGHSTDLMDDGGDWSRDYTARILHKIRHKITQEGQNLSGNDRLGITEDLTRLPCLIGRCDTSAGQPHRPRIPLLLTGTYNVLLNYLLDGTENEVNAALRRKAYHSLRCTIEHHAIDLDRQSLEPATQSLLTGLKDPDRSVRLSAGYGLASLVLLYSESLSNPWHLTQSLFGRLYQHMNKAKDHLKEVAIIAVGSMGKTKNAEVLGQVLCFLIAQLGKHNPVIKGTASTQLMDISKRHKKKLYILLLPYLDQVAPFLVSKMWNQRSLLLETCRLMNMVPSDFISLTAPRTYPQLFAACDMKAVDAVAHEVGQKPSALFLTNSHTVLAHIFMLPKQADSNKAFAFILKLLTDASQSSTINMQVVVKSCLVPLLADLVVAMGDENDTNAQLATVGLKKVERVVNVTTKNDNVPAVELGAFLKIHMLGLITHINEMLQEVKGKKTVGSKRKIIRSLGALIEQIGQSITNVAPQVMATFQTMICIPELSEVTLHSWHKFLTTLGPTEVGPHVGPTTAAIITSWNSFTPDTKQAATESLAYITQQLAKGIGRYLDDVVDLSSIPELRHLHEHVAALRSDCTPKEQLRRILERSSNDNLSVAIQSLEELKIFLLADKDKKELIMNLVSGDMFDPIIGNVVVALMSTACRDGDGTDPLRALAYECIGILGAVDPDRCDITMKQPRSIVKNNFTDEEESMQFALHLICDLLVNAFRSTSDITYQSHLAYTIQELLKFCQFKPALVGAGTATSISNKIRNRWKSLPKHILETVTPLLEGRFTLTVAFTAPPMHPIYPKQLTYREWIQVWTTHLITRASGPTAQIIFNVFRSVVRNKDVVVAHYLLPHLVLNILISGSEVDAQDIRTELTVVLEDQIKSGGNSTPDKRLLSAQAVFMLLDHLNAWVRVVRQDLNTKKAESKRARGERSLANTQLEDQLIRVDSILSSIDHHLMAQAAFQCKAFARSLMNFERYILSVKERAPQSKDLPDYYERLHEIYAQLDEPDGMEGVSTLILAPSLEHQIRQHESTGRWTSAQSCWEVRLQQSPDNVDFHLGLLRCLRNLGHYDTLRTHVRGVLTRKPEWQNALAGFQIESAWMVGAWDDVDTLVGHSTDQTAQMVIGRVLLAMRHGDPKEISDALANARLVLGTPITAAGPSSYRRSYDAVLDLHLTHELEIIHQAAHELAQSQGRSQQKKQIVDELSKMLTCRLDSTLPTFRFRELVLSMRRTAFALSNNPHHILTTELGRIWLASAKIARKAGQWQTAYSAMLQARESGTKFCFMESAKLVKMTGEPLRALQELDNSMRLAGLFDSISVMDLTVDEETTRLRARAHILRARWMNESQRYDVSLIYKLFQLVTELDKNSESAHFYLGQFHDECFKNLTPAEQQTRGLKMKVATVRAYSRAMRQGSKYVYQTVPRLLTIWLDLGEGDYTEKEARETVLKCHEHAAKAIRDVPAYKWYTAFPQIVSRVGHSSPETYKILSKLILKVLEAYPKQALWLFTSVVKSTKSNREQRGRAILDQLKNNPRVSRTQTPRLVQQCVSMTNELLGLCDYHVDDEKKALSMRKDFPRLAQLGRCDLIIPLQESLTATLPPTSSTQSDHQPFPLELPMFSEFHDEIDIMRSLARPRKISILGTDGQTYMFLGKPKDDLRKDARLMEFNSIINKLLKANSESRKRQLHIRTYGVVTLNEECGFIQWVPNTIPIRPVLMNSYDTRRIRSWSTEMNDVFKKIKDADDNTASLLFTKNILPKFPPVFHEWFLETFPEPTAWLASRMTYGRTAAVMSMVGFILGLGDRHCENILLDSNTGDVVHVDFNCLFEKGKTLETPERIPFRLTQNLVDGLGVTGVEGVFRVACEVTLQLLRDNKDSLMSVLDTFIHDPLVEWEDEKRRLDRQRNQTKTTIDVLAKNALGRIEKKLQGIYIPDASRDRNKQEKEVTTSNLVQILIQEATDNANLAKMYPGWAAWH